MIDATFNAAVEMTLRHEGGYVDDPVNGESKFGIAKRLYPSEDIANLTVDRAKTIYFTDFWMRPRISQLPGVLVPCKTFDTAVWRGPVRAITLLQASLVAAGYPVAQDGQIGPETIQACRAASRSDVLGRYRAMLVEQIDDLVGKRPEFTRFLAGWIARAKS